MRRLVLLTIIVVFLAACLPQSDQAPAAGGTAPKSEEAQTTEESAPVVILRCEDVDGNDPNTKGKTVIYYSDDTKETFNDKCGEGELGFQIEYVCEGTTAKTMINKCGKECLKGVCFN